MRNVASAVTSWSSDNSSVISVSSKGLAIAHAASGTANITATVRAPGWVGQFTIMVSAAPAILEFISVTPFNSSVNVTSTVQYKAIAHYSDGTAPDITTTATWAVINNIGGTTGQATIIAGPGATGGLATGVSSGVTEITASFTASNGTITGGSYLNVGLTAITISPTSPSVPKGEKQQFDATGTFSGVAGGVDITSYVFWHSNTASVAGITSSVAACAKCSAGGLASTFGTGTSNITASSGTITSNIAVLTVTPAIVTMLDISPPGSCNPSGVPRGNSCQFSALAIYSDNTTSTVTNSATWSSDNPNCAAVSSTGLVTTLSSVTNPCTANISASFSSVNSNMVGLAVTPHVLLSISITPANPTQPKGNSQTFKVRAKYTDGTVTVANGASGPQWASSNTSVATINSSSGLASTTNSTTGTTNIGATYSGMQASTVFTVTAQAIKSIAVSPQGRVPLNPDDGSTTIPLTTSQQFMATATFTDNSTSDVTGSVDWTSSNTNIASFDPNSPGEANASTTTPGMVTVTATDAASNIAGTAPLTVAAITSITVKPPTVTLAPGATQSFATLTVANYGGGVTQLLAPFGPTWSSNHPNVATVDQNGLATAVSAGPPVATITAQLGAATCSGAGCGAVTVSAAVLQSITVSCDPNNPCNGSGESVLQLGQTEQMVATGNYSDGTTQDLTSKTTWASSSASVATIGLNTGFLTTQGLGSTNITATCTNGGACPGATSTVIGTLPLTVTF